MLHPSDSPEWQLSLRVEKKNRDIVLDRDIQIYALPDEPTPWDLIPLAHYIPIGTDSEESYAFASNALTKCLSSHRLCDSPRGGFLPSRLVDVVSPEAPYVRVVETFGMNPAENKYCALSHCWGPPESITTQLNDETYEEYKKGIPVTALPNTFLNAVVFARKLGQRYIWIDSLCIIQGNREDWLKEGAKMSKIYENSLLTRAAASSSSGHGGLFYRSPRIEIAGNAPEKSGKAYRVFARFNITHQFFDFPLNNRAWVL